MHLLGERTLGVVLLVLLAAVVAAKRLGTGSFVGDRPPGDAWLRLVNAFNLAFLLVVNPLAILLLLWGRLRAVDPTHFRLPADLLIGAEGAGLVLYAAGCGLMAWALLTLGRTYQVGGSAPRAGDRLVTAGPYRLVRHPMYASALAIALGLGGLLQSAIALTVFAVYVAIVALLVPAEERALAKAYGEPYQAYRRQTKRLIPWLV